MPAAQLTVTSPRTGTTFAAVATVAHASKRTFALTVLVNIRGLKRITARAHVAAGCVTVVSVTTMAVDGRGFPDDVDVYAGATRDLVIAGVGYMWAKMEAAALAEVEAGIAAREEAAIAA